MHFANPDNILLVERLKEKGLQMQLDPATQSLLIEQAKWFNYRLYPELLKKIPEMI